MGFSFFSDLINPTKYDVPAAPQVDVTQEQEANVKSNLGSFQSAKVLAQQYNDFMAQQVQSRLKQNLPYMANLESTMANNYANMLKGKLSLSDSAAVQRSAAARALGSGVNVAGLTARDLGLSQYQIQQTAQTQVPGFLGAMSGLKAAPMFDFSNVFMSPQQRIAVQMQNAENKWNVANMKAQMDAQPEPWMKAFAGLGDSVINAAASYFTMNPSSMMGNGNNSSGSMPGVGQQANMMKEFYGGYGGKAVDPLLAQYFGLY